MFGFLIEKKKKHTSAITCTYNQIESNIQKQIRQMIFFFLPVNIDVLHKDEMTDFSGRSTHLIDFILVLQVLN